MSITSPNINTSTTTTNTINKTSATIITLNQPKTNNNSKGNKRIKTQAELRPKCNVCSKKLLITKQFKCVCGKEFCRIHKFPESHFCNFDFKADARKKLESENPLIRIKKL
ncbi:Zinc finger A20 and AN1 domain-containing stress-associated protein 1 [Cucumispora dikerogammari]|nr:Zinc finger A20 and AN1 domain-containing stress-associated protein 1 [Cucumispora dikerogammari]